MKKIIIIFALYFLLLPVFSYAQNATLTPPENLQQAKELGQKAVETGQRELPGIIQTIWQEQVLPVWQKMWEMAKSPWNNQLKPWLETQWQKIKVFLGYEIETNKPAVQKELQKQQKNIQQETPKIQRSIWEKLKEIIKI